MQNYTINGYTFTGGLSDDNDQIVSPTRGELLLIANQTTDVTLTILTRTLYTGGVSCWSK